MLGLPWVRIAAPILLVIAIFMAGWTVNGWRIGKKNVKLKADIQKAEEREDAWKKVAETCQGNRGTLETALEDLNTSFTSVAESRERLQGAVDIAWEQATERAAAEDELARLEGEHAALVERAVSMTACQTYEAVLVALAGGGQ